MKKRNDYLEYVIDICLKLAYMAFTIWALMGFCHYILGVL